MPSEHASLGSLADIIENAERIEGYLTGMDRESFAANGMVRDAVERCLERVYEGTQPPPLVIGEIASSRPGMIDIIEATEVRPLGNHRLFIRFSDGACGKHDFADPIAEPSPMSTPLRDPIAFARVFVELGVPTRPNGFDLDAGRLA